METPTRTGSPSLERRRPPFQERGHPFPVVVGREEQGGRLDRLGKPVARVPVDELLSDLDCELRVRRDAPRERERLVEQLLVRHDGLDEADLERLVRADDVSGEREPAVQWRPITSGPRTSP